MPGGNARVIRVLVASPGDLDVERDTVGTAVEELNLGLAPSQNMRLELVRWETHASPELGSDPQHIINRQLGDDFEVFIGLLWTRFGTTPLLRPMSWWLALRGAAYRTPLRNHQRETQAELSRRNLW